LVFRHHATLAKHQVVDSDVTEDLTTDAGLDDDLESTRELAVQIDAKAVGNSFTDVVTVRMLKLRKTAGSSMHKNFSSNCLSWMVRKQL